MHNRQTKTTISRPKIQTTRPNTQPPDRRRHEEEGREAARTDELYLILT